MGDRHEPWWEADTVVLPVPARPARPAARIAVAVIVAVVVIAVLGAVGQQLLVPPDPTTADGVVTDGVTVFDDVPAVAELDPDLLDALRRAATDAGFRFAVNSGWRSPRYQDQLLREAVAKYGSEEEAARWVSTSETSRHVSGDAVDLGTRAAAWLSRRGAAYGLCRVYRNEPWHYELRPDAVDDGCPPQYADPTHDPRMQK